MRWRTIALVIANLIMLWFSPEVIEPVVYKVFGLPWWIVFIAIFLFVGTLCLNIGTFVLEILNKRK